MTGPRHGSLAFWTITLPREGRSGSDDNVRDEGKRLVSCIIIFLNEEKYLAEAIESVVAQSYADWELLLVDDGSTDGSEAIARAYCDRFPAKIRYLTHERRRNCGMSASRNLGLRSARGEFAAFLDGDDCWYPDKLERQVALFDQHPEAIMICGATLYWHSWQAIAGDDDRVMQVGQRDKNDGATVLALDQDRLYAGRDLLRRLYPLGKGVSPSMSGNMFRRDMALALGGFDESFAVCSRIRFSEPRSIYRARSSSPTKSSIATVSMTNPASASQRRQVSPTERGASFFCGWGSISTRSTAVTPSCA